MVWTNIADAAASIRNGELGPFSDVKIGKLVVSALIGMSAPTELLVTNKPIQKGYAITDAAVEWPRDVVLEICLANPDYSAEAGISAALTGSVASFTETWRDKKTKLYALKSTREIVDVQTHEDIFKNLIVRMIEPIYDSYDAFFATVILQPVRYDDATTEGGIKDSAEESKGNL